MGRQSLFNNRIGTEFGSKKWLSLDPCGLACATLSYSIHIYALITMYFHLVPHSSDIAGHDNHSHSPTDTLFDNMAEGHDSNNKLDGFATAIQIIFYALYLPMTVMALLSLVMAQHSNPGAVPLGARPLPVTCSPVSSPMNSNHNSSGEELQNDTYIDNHNANTNGSDDGKNLLSSFYPVGVTDGNNGQLDNIDINVARTNDGTSTSAGGASLSLTSSQKMKLKRRRGIRRCRKCNDNYKPPRAHHDSVTGRCIVKFDHFCPWVGNAVGALNHKFFFLFVLYTFLSSILSIIIIIIQFFRCGFSVPIYDQYYPNPNSTSSDNDFKEISTDDMNAMDNYNHTNYTHHNNHNNQTIFLQNDDDSYDITFKYTGCESIYSPSVLVLFVVSFIFLFFTCCMLFEQWDAIESNTSKIARMKMRMGHADADEYKRVSQDFNEFFGVGFDSKNGNGNSMALHWFLPLPIRFPPGTRDKVLGYEYRDEWYGLVYDEGMDDEVEDEEEDEYDLELGRSRRRKKQDDEGAVESNDFSNSSEHSDSVNVMHRRAGTSSSVLLNEDEESIKEHLNLELGLTAGSEDVKQRKAVKKRISFRDDISTGSASSGTNKRSENESKHALKVV